MRTISSKTLLDLFSDFQLELIINRAVMEDRTVEDFIVASVLRRLP